MAVEETKTVPNKQVSLRKEAATYSGKLEKRGVIYISRIPPFMKPNKARAEFEEYGEVTRIYLAEEDASRRRKRKMNGGNGSKQFVEGWVEFADKHIAKSVAASLNNQPIGVKKGDFYHDDVWNLKYLKGFKWDYLTEKIAYERRVKEAKLQASMLQAKRQNAEFVELVEKNKTEKFVEARKKKRKAEAVEVHGCVEEGDSKKEATTKSMLKRNFKQHQPIAQQHGERGQKIDEAVLRSVFPRAQTGIGIAT